MYNRIRIITRNSNLSTLSQYNRNKYSYGLSSFTSIIRPKKSILNLTDKALNEILRVSTSEKIVKLSLNVKGCNGYTYDLTLIDKSKIDPMDELYFDDKGNEILVIDGTAVMYVLGTKIDFEEQDDGLTSQFTFENPNVGSCCGCGMSFNFNPKIN